jgi:RNase adapter protein RapZ
MRSHPLQFAPVEHAGRGTQTWIVTGMSGAGKATALRALESAGIAGVDNLPVPLIDAFTSAHRAHPAVAVVDARRGDELTSIEAITGARVVFLDAPDSVLVRRLADSSRPHPCAAAGVGQAAVSAERSLLVPLRAAADVVIDTGAMTEAELTDRILEVVAPGRGGAAAFRCTVSSFGFKYGQQAEADWVIDSRILPNPFWEADLRPLTGLDQPVRDFVMRHSESQELVERGAALLGWVIDVAERRGRKAVHIAVGCTGGRHRSVVIATELAARLGEGDVVVDLRHRDVHRPDPR